LLLKKKRNFLFYSKIIVESSNDVCTIVAGGVTLHEAIKASEKLKSLGKAVRVIDAFTVKPIDRDTILKSVNATHNRLIVVEDHYPEGLIVFISI
jgi:transketolase